MNVVKLIFKPKTQKIDDFRVSFLLTDFCNALCSNGQIHNDYTVIKNNDIYSAIVTLIGTDALNEKYNSEYVKEHKKEIELIYDIAVETLGANIYADENYCTCGCKTGYILFSTYVNSGSPIHCLDCWREVPLYKLPHIQKQKDYHGETLWAHYFMKAVDTLGTYNWATKWAKKQLADPNSELSKEGIEICADFEKATGKPFYYLLITDSDKSKLLKICPICGEPWRNYEIKSEEGNSIELCLCDKCRLALDSY